jgi:hypothetical protein
VAIGRADLKMGFDIRGNALEFLVGMYVDNVETMARVLGDISLDFGQHRALFAVSDRQGGPVANLPRDRVDEREALDVKEIRRKGDVLMMIQDVRYNPREQKS